MRDDKLEERKNKFQQVNMPILEARQNFKLSLRKQKIEEIISHRREKSILKYEKKEYEINVANLLVPQELVQKQFNSIEEFYQFVKDLLNKKFSEEIDFIKLGIHLLRTYLSREQDLPLDFIMSEGFLPSIKNIMTEHASNEILVYETLWCITNISYATVDVAVEALSDSQFLNIYKYIFELYEEKNQIIVEQLVWHLGNLSADNYMTREAIIQIGLYDKIYKLLRSDRVFEGFVVNAVWFFTTCLKSRPEMKEESVHKAVDIAILFVKTNDEEITSDSLWAISYASESNYSSVVKKIVESNICEYLMTAEKFKKIKYYLASIRTLGNLLSNECYVVDYLIGVNCINFLSSFLHHPMNNIKKENLWAISNICAGTLNQILAVLDSCCISTVLENLRDNNYDLVREALYVVSTMIYGGNFEVCFRLAEMGLIDYFILMLKNCRVPELLCNSLQALYSFLSYGVNSDYNSNCNMFTKLFAEKGGVEALQLNHYHTNDKVYNLVTLILDTFFNVELVNN